MEEGEECTVEEEAKPTKLDYGVVCGEGSGEGTRERMRSWRRGGGGSFDRSTTTGGRRGVALPHAPLLDGVCPDGDGAYEGDGEWVIIAGSSGGGRRVTTKVVAEVG